jgi:serine/threonine protein kinase
LNQRQAFGPAVARKFLPEAFTFDPDRLARFSREAQLLASLNHPNIGAIYGLEESNHTRALVLELVEGPTLADRIADGPLPFDEALPVARQIAEAVEAAQAEYSRYRPSGDHASGTCISPLAGVVTAKHSRSVRHSRR